jgi:hypothetical protein
MTLLLALRVSSGDTSTAQEGFIGVETQSSVSVEYAYQHNVSVGAKSAITVTPTVEQSIKIAAKSSILVWHELS